MKRHNKKAVPLLVGRTSDDGMMIDVWCPYCKRCHTHGWSSDNASNDVEHRVAHCDASSPFYASGYYIGKEQ